MTKQTVVFDFDGVIHSYTSGWQGEAVIPDPVVPGIPEALRRIHDAGYEIVVVSTRCATITGMEAVVTYLNQHNLMLYIDRVSAEKPPAIVYIDDRALYFDGHPESLLEKIQMFQPWYKKSEQPVSRCACCGRIMYEGQHYLQHKNGSVYCSYRCLAVNGCHDMYFPIELHADGNKPL